MSKSVQGRFAAGWCAGWTEAVPRTRAPRNLRSIQRPAPTPSLCSRRPSRPCDNNNLVEFGTSAGAHGPVRRTR